MNITGFRSMCRQGDIRANKFFILSLGKNFSTHEITGWAYSGTVTSTLQASLFGSVECQHHTVFKIFEQKMRSRDCKACLLWEYGFWDTTRMPKWEDQKGRYVRETLHSRFRIIPPLLIAYWKVPIHKTLVLKVWFLGGFVSSPSETCAIQAPEEIIQT